MLGHATSGAPAAAALLLLLLLPGPGLFSRRPGAHAAEIRLIEPTLVGDCPAQLLNPLVRAAHTVCPMPQTDIKRIRPYRSGSPPAYPWSHPVRCQRPHRTGTQDLRGGPFTATYCLYTDATYGGLHGVSLITQPEAAVDLVGADAFEARPYYGGASPRKIPQGTIAMLDLPAIILSKAFLEDAAPVPRRRLIRRGLAQLPAATQARVFALSRSTGGDPVDAILGTNTISLALGMNELHLGLYPELSRINHACNPNAYHRFSPRTLSVEVVAYRDIQPGEEITISYAQLTLSRTERRAFVHDNYHFNCTCTLCRADPDAMTASEDRRRDMRKLQATLGSATRSGQYAQALDAAEQLLATTAAEGVTPLLAEMYDILGSIHLDLNHFATAARYGQQALAAWERLDSVDDAQLVSARWFVALEEAALAEQLEDFF
ncbi:SET domain protein [Niveomyces insectorum RCEF 264]|uniref:SET domain protein n=1 Tax=Niveomyces insectorum RCEF 264 TaxID=1081102 RepID=A0A167SF04_9HYPO|nr:SET domain protein [Niveomyces insectorum RCEF 264]